MVDRAVNKGVALANVFHLPNWVDTTAIFPLDRPSEFRRDLGIGEHTAVVLYSGNMGAKQGLEVLAEAAAALASRDDIVFVFCGNGATKKQLQKRCADLPNTRFLCLQPVERLNELLNLADIHVLPQRGDVADLVMPSKLTGMFASARAVIAMAHPGTELHEAVNGRGEVIEPENAEALIGAIEMLVGNPDLRARHGEEGRLFAQERLAPAAVFLRLQERLVALADSRLPNASEVREAASQTRSAEVADVTLTRMTERSPILPRVEKIE
jgi:colanic acid biosynthesis glycosyl transferase WcaI